MIRIYSIKEPQILHQINYIFHWDIRTRLDLLKDTVKIRSVANNDQITVQENEDIFTNENLGATTVHPISELRLIILID